MFIGLLPQQPSVVDIVCLFVSLFVSLFVFKMRKQIEMLRNVVKHCDNDIKSWDLSLIFLSSNADTITNQLCDLGKKVDSHPKFLYLIK